MWYVRSRPGVINAFHAAYGTHDDSELVAAYDRMSVNLPVSSGNPAALRVAAATSQHGKFGVAQRMHTHVGQFYGPEFKGPEYYAIVPLFDMNRNTGATALVPGSHRKVREIEERWHQKWGLKGHGQRSAEERLLAPLTWSPSSGTASHPASPTSRPATASCSTPLSSTAPTQPKIPRGRVATAKTSSCEPSTFSAWLSRGCRRQAILEARRKAYELDVFWPPTIGHAAFAQHIVAGKLEGQYEPSLRGVTRPSEAAEGTLEKALQLALAGRQDTRGEVFPRIREFAKAEPEVQRLIDPTYAEAAKL